ncbi:iron chelate uptake ABC transporter family permease subunit [Sinorhizobium sp. BG8]|uniref:FecCD family ABC transporter permease n=1 Tax=Sinorhizobium sp. BG8 TaxID=2613773 RepID=UPI00193E7401|nr:iron chelate uptake ABC transporter family permease subunit [Sinorhizobium sp. BG8]QRM56130.1 iron chelate uptake ABC transporter family permease subunit [Sinorhizobium sp. BG8]
MAAPAHSGAGRGHGLRLAGLLAGLLALGVVAATSILVGAKQIAPATALQSLTAFDADLVEHVVIRDYRLPRTLLGLLAGSAFGVSGALIQAAARNPLADPGILGVNSGAAFFVTIAVGLLGLRSIEAYIWFALLGAFVVTMLVYAVGSSGREGATPVRLLLAGVAISAMLGGIGSAITLLDPQAFDSMRHWSIGSLAGRDIGVVTAVAPFIAAGLVLAFVVARSLNAMALGDDLSRALGARLVRARVLTVIAVTLLAGAATAAAGPIAFIGLMVPHAVRWFTGPDQRWIVLYSVVFSSIFLLVADVAGRLVVSTNELEAGIVAAFVGAPVLIALVRSRKARSL